MCSTDFNLNLEDFPTLPPIAPVRNSASFSKSIIKVVSTSSVCTGKLICGGNVPPSKLVNASFVCTSKNPLVLEMSVQVKLSVLVC